MTKRRSSLGVVGVLYILVLLVATVGELAYLVWLDPPWVSEYVPAWARDLIDRYAPPRPEPRALPER